MEIWTPPKDLWIPDRRFKAILVAAPKTGKTGSIAALVNAGYRVILAAFDPGYDILLNMIEPEKLQNLIILPFEDPKGFQDTGSITVGNDGEPVAFAKFAQFLNTGRARTAKCQGAEVVELGHSETWGYDTFLALDNITSVSGTAMDRYLAQIGSNRLRMRRKDWGLSASEVDQVLIQMTSDFYRYHFIALAHWKVQGPREWEDEDKKNPEKTDYNNELRQAEKELIPTKMVPRSIGRGLSENLVSHFPTAVWAEVTDDGDRIFNLKPTSVRDSGVPVRPGRLPDVLPIDTGLLTIFEAVTGKPQ